MVLSALGAGLLSGGVSTLGSLLGFGSQQMTNKANMELAKYQFDRNLEMWNMQNEYNTPKNQVARMIDANLNPALMYGSGTVANTASEAPKYEAPKLQAYTDFSMAGNAINAALTAEKTAAETQNINAQTNRTSLLTKFEAHKMQLEIIAQGYINAKSEVEKDFWKDQFQSALDLTKSTISLNDSKSQDNIASAGEHLAKDLLITAQTETVDALRPQQVINEEKKGKVLDSEAYKNNTQGDSNKAAARLADQQAKYYKKLESKVGAEVSKLLAEAEFINCKTDGEKFLQKTRITGEICNLFMDAILKNEKINDQRLNNEINSILINKGVNLRNNGYMGISADKFAYGLGGIWNWLVNITGMPSSLKY